MYMTECFTNSVSSKCYRGSERKRRVCVGVFGKQLHIERTCVGPNIQGEVNN